MKNSILLLLIFCLTLTACGQKKQSFNYKNLQKSNIKMGTSKLINITVKEAFNAWQEGNSEKFLSYFTTDAKLTDDGNPRDLQKFVNEACGTEKFTTIDKVENDGKDIFGHFHTEKWGDFNVYFKFHVNQEGKIHQLDIGQVH